MSEEQLELKDLSIEDIRNLPEEPFEPNFNRSQETQDYQPDTTTQKEWQAIRDECVSGGSIDERCSLIQASNGTGTLEVVAKRLACGCILIPVDSDEVPL